jgi:hypothetical protein
MLWQYRTILFEFTKDGLLGDKYVDDEEMEKALNELGGQEWELVSVSLLQDGLLAFLKRPAQEDVVVELPRAAEPAAPPVVPSRPVIAPRHIVTAEQIEEEEREHIRGLEQQRKSAMRKEEKDFVGDIRIS